MYRKIAEYIIENDLGARATTQYIKEAYSQLKNKDCTLEEFTGAISEETAKLLNIK